MKIPARPAYLQPPDPIGSKRADAIEYSDTKESL